MLMISAIAFIPAVTASMAQTIVVASRLAIGYLRFGVKQWHSAGDLPHIRIAPLVERMAMRACDSPYIITL
jgi:hypothetical protein